VAIDAPAQLKVLAAMHLLDVANADRCELAQGSH
jgi:hypothetical protein